MTFTTLLIIIAVIAFIVGSIMTLMRLATKFKLTDAQRKIIAEREKEQLLKDKQR